MRGLAASQPRSASEKTNDFYIGNQTLVPPHHTRCTTMSLSHVLAVSYPLSMYLVGDWGNVVFVYARMLYRDRGYGYRFKGWTLLAICEHIAITTFAGLSYIKIYF